MKKLARLLDSPWFVIFIFAAAGFACDQIVSGSIDEFLKVIGL